MNDGYIAEIRLYAGTFAPQNWMHCDGQTLDINTNQSLYSILGTTYGGDGRTNFQLPKLEMAGSEVKYIICVEGIYPTRN